MKTKEEMKELKISTSRGSIKVYIDEETKNKYMILYGILTEVTDEDIEKIMKEIKFAESLMLKKTYKIEK